MPDLKMSHGKMMPHLKMSHGKMSAFFCLISIVWVHFNNKSEKFPYLKSLEYFNIFFIKKNDVRFEYVGQKQSLIKFNLRCLRRNLIS